MLKHLIPVLSLIAAVVLLVMLNFTTPAGIGPLGVLVFFTTIYVLMLGISVALVKLFLRLTGRQAGRKSYLYGAVIAFGPIMLLLAQSLKTMSPLTVALVALFVFVGCFVVNKRGEGWVGGECGRGWVRWSRA